MANNIGWGKGASNNSIGWGNVGTNGFGSIYNRSNSGETDLSAQEEPLPDDFIIEVNTELDGESNSDQFQFTGAVGEYDVKAFQNDTEVASFENLVNQQTITLPSAGIYELRVIIKEAGFNKLTFNNGGDRLKLLKVLNWGLYGVNELNQGFAFRGCSNLTEIADNGKWFDVVTNGTRMFENNSLTSLPVGMELPLLTQALFMFRSNSIESLPAGMKLPSLTNGTRMFENNSLESLPARMELPNLTIGENMFSNNSLESLPSGMELPNLINGFGMFISNSLTSLPSGMELNNLSDGTSMFISNSLESLPSGMELPLLSNGTSMFNGNSLTSLPSGMELPNLINGLSMFRDNSLTSLPSGMELPLLSNGTSMFLASTINTERYSQLLIDLEANNNNDNVAFHGGNSQYNAQGEIARNALIARGWTITDGGLEN